MKHYASRETTLFVHFPYLTNLFLVLRVKEAFCFKFVLYVLVYFQFNDVLLYTTPVATGYKLNNVLPLAGMKVRMVYYMNKNFERKIVNIFLPISFNICFVCSEEQ